MSEDLPSQIFAQLKQFYSESQIVNEKSQPNSCKSLLSMDSHQSNNSQEREKLTQLINSHPEKGKILGEISFMKWYHSHHDLSKRNEKNEIEIEYN